MQSQAKVVIVGGGIMGVALLYHLAEEGWTDSLLIEKGELTSGSTWHAAGLCPSFIANYSMAQIHHYTNTLYPKLEALTGQAVGWHGCGSIRFALNQGELDWFRYVEGVAKNVGFRMQIVSPEEIQKINPFVTTEGVVAGAWTLDDGHVDPAGACNAMALGAKNLGASLLRDTCVTAIHSRPNGEWEVVTEGGRIICEHVVNAAGCYAQQIGAWVGLNVPITNIKHQYIITGTVPEFLERESEMPVMRDPYSSSYFRQEQKAGMIGIYETRGSQDAWQNRSGPAWESSNELFPPELEHVMPWVERVMERIPIFEEAGVKRIVNGAIPHTPDDNPLLGPAPGLRNFWQCCGSSIGIAQGGGSGKYLAQWMVHGEAEINMLPVDPRRFGPYSDHDYTDAKAHQAYVHMYDLQLPGEERPAARPARTTPMYEKLKAKGAMHTEVFGWERPRWFALDGRTEEYGFRRNNIFEVVGEECKAVRERVGVLELSSFAKFEVQGAAAESFLNRICANRVSLRVGGIVLTHVLTEHGCIENEFTITRLADDHYYLLSAALAEQRDFDFLHQKKHEEAVQITNVTDDWGILVLAGPRSREVLSKITPANLSNEHFRWLTAQSIEVAGVALRALRVNYVGELGWELHTPMSELETVYEALWQAGAECGIADFGVSAVNSLRMEKAYRSWGAELTNEITLIEADMERFIKFDKEDFIGRSALLARQQEGCKTQLAYVEVAAEDADVAGGEAILEGEKVVGLATSGGYGYAVGKSLAFVYVEPHLATPGATFDIEILGKRCPAKVLPAPIYDPQNERMRA